MASREQVQLCRRVELRSLPATALAVLLDEEKARWLALLHWDFGPSADLVLRYAAMQALEGYALVDGTEVVGYTYWVSEEHKGLVGDLYVRDAWRTPANENLLLEGALAQLRRSPWIRRVEAQLMHLASRGSQLAPSGLRPRAFCRHFMLAPTDGIEHRRTGDYVPELRYQQWSPRYLEDAAELIAHVYYGHVDGEINDQYHSAHGARRFLQNIVQYPGCGHFSPQCSWLAIDAAGRTQGLCLATMVSEQSGHIAQICLAPEYQGSGAGYEMLRRSMAALVAGGASEVSLTVTASNERAIRLYDRFGFRAVYQFDALVWEKLWP